MPLIEPMQGESKKDFISRCITSKKMEGEFPDKKQREAVCYKQWRKNRDDAAAAAARKAAGVAEE